jgi:hypothetical protein
VPTTIGSLVQTGSGWAALAFWSTIGAKIAFDFTGADSLSSRIEDLVKKHHYTRRERTMTSAIDTIAVSKEPHRPLLAQMGRSHVEPITALLQKEFGWTIHPIKKSVD